MILDCESNCQLKKEKSQMVTWCPFISLNSELYKWTRRQKNLYSTRSVPNSSFGLKISNQSSIKVSYELNLI